MEYNEIKKIAKSNKLDLKVISKQLDMTPYGFRVAIENETYPIGKVKSLCEILGITVAQFFDEEPIAGHKPVSYTQTGKNNTIAAEGSSVVFGSESEVQFLRQQVRQLTEMNRDLIKTMKK